MVDGSSQGGWYFVRDGRLGVVLVILIKKKKWCIEKGKTENISTGNHLVCPDSERRYYIVTKHNIIKAKSFVLIRCWD